MRRMMMAIAIFGFVPWTASFVPRPVPFSRGPDRAGLSVRLGARAPQRPHAASPAGRRREIEKMQEREIKEKRTILQKDKVHASTRVIIVGGGIGGLAAALGLARRGFRVKVLERDARFSARRQVVHSHQAEAGE